MPVDPPRSPSSSDGRAPRGAERRAAIADAAIHLVATKGLRGLTHRGVDDAAGLPPGSTSYYLRTRQSLVGACFARMIERDIGSAAELDPGGDLVDLLSALVLAQARHRQEDLAARYELSLEASRNPELRQPLADAGRRLRTMLGQLLATHGVAEAELLAWPVAAMLDGLMYDRVAGVGADRSDDDFATAARRAIAALVDGLLSPRDRQGADASSTSPA